MAGLTKFSKTRPYPAAHHLAQTKRLGSKVLKGSSSRSRLRR
jgi:hypothetical protein